MTDRRVTGQTASGRRDGTGERVTVNLTAKAAEAMRRTAEVNGDTKTDTINRALVVYAFLDELERNGGTVFIREKGTEELERVRFL